MKASCAAELIVRCFDARNNAHIFHLQALKSSYALHKALEAFYEGIIPLADTFAESYQGVHGLIDATRYPESSKRPADPMALLTDLRKWIMANRDDIGGADDTEIQNNIDEIVSLVDQTMYMVRFFK